MWCKVGGFSVVLVWSVLRWSLRSWVFLTGVFLALLFLLPIKLNFACICNYSWVEGNLWLFPQDYQTCACSQYRLLSPNWFLTTHSGAEEIFFYPSPALMGLWVSPKGKEGFLSFPPEAHGLCIYFDLRNNGVLPCS